ESTKAANTMAPKRSRLFMSSRSNVANTVATSAENTNRISRWLAGIGLALASHGDVVGVEDHEHVQQAADGRARVAVLEGDRLHVADLEAQRLREEVGHAHRHLRQAEQRGEDVLAGGAGELEPGVHRDAHHEQREDAAQEHETAADASKIKMTGSRQEP